MGLFDLNKVKGEATTLLPGIRQVFLKDVKAKDVNGQVVLEFSFVGRGQDSGFYNASFFASTFDPDHQYNASLDEEGFAKKVQRELGKVKTLVQAFLRLPSLPSAESFEELAEEISDLFDSEDESADWKSIEAEIKLVYTKTDKVVLPLFAFISTPLSKRTLKIDPKNEYDRITPLAEINTDAAFSSLAGDDETTTNDDLM
jgi:hypothetical protein